MTATLSTTDRGECAPVRPASSSRRRSVPSATTRDGVHDQELERVLGGDVLRIPPRGGGEADVWWSLPERTREALIRGEFVVKARRRVVGINGKIKMVENHEGRPIDELGDMIRAAVPGVDDQCSAIEWWVRECLAALEERQARGRALGLRKMHGTTTRDDEWAAMVAYYGGEEAAEREMAARWGDTADDASEASTDEMIGESGAGDTTRDGSDDAATDRGPRFFAYLRVSTTGQADRETIATQAAVVAEWCDERGIDLADVFIDDGVSGSEGIERRIGLASALDELKAGDTLIVYRLDRLARDLLLQETLLGTIWRKGASIVSCSPAEAEHLVDDPTDPSRRLVRQIMGAVSEYERGMIRARTLAGRRRRKMLGEHVEGPVPYGYQKIGRHLFEKAGEIEHLRTLHDMQLAGLSYQKMADYMTKTTGEEWLRMRCHRVLARYRREIGWESAA